MAQLRDLVNRRKAVRNIRKITRTMELIATARFKKAMDRASEAEAYTRKIAEIAADLTGGGGDASHPLLESRPVKKTLLLVLNSNRGLCGGYNGGIQREAVGRLRKCKEENLPYELDLSGKRAISFFRYQGYKAERTYTHFEDKPSFDQVEEIAEKYIAMYTAGQIDKLEIAYQKFLTAARQTPVIETLLPMTPVVDPKAVKTEAKGNVDYEFLPNASEILEAIVPVAFKQRLFKCFLDAAVSEQIARRVAMKAATENSADLIKEISRKYNRARQANITKEISELIAGSEALK